jgi:hypothetical protein
VRYYDEENIRPRASFATRTEAADFLKRKLDEVARLRRGEASAVVGV